jgi:anti-anti-sigma factor
MPSASRVNPAASMLLRFARAADMGFSAGMEPGWRKMEIKNKTYGDILVLSPEGRIDHANSEDFRGSLAPLIERCKTGGERMVLDLAGVDYISSAGLRCFMLAEKQAKAQGGTIVVAAMQPVVKEIFEISRFTLVFETFASVRDAIAKLSPAALKAYQA